MKRTSSITIIILGFVIMIFSTCNLFGEYEGEITVTDGTILPFWVGWLGYQNSSNIDGIEVIQAGSRNIIRVSSYNSFSDILKIQCNCIKPCHHESINTDENVIENLLENFNPKFFETKNLIITELIGGVTTMNFRVNRINNDGIINITETVKRTLGDTVALGISLMVAIEIDSSFITPSSMSISKKRVFN